MPGKSAYKSLHIRAPNPRAPAGLNLGEVNDRVQPPSQDLNPGGPSDFPISMYVAIVIAVSYFIVETWPVSLAFALVLTVWLVSRKREPAIARNIHDAALPVLIGTGSFWLLSLIVVLAPHWSEDSRKSLLEGEQWLLEVRLYIRSVSGPNLKVYLLVLAVLLALLYFFPQSGAIGNLLRAKKKVARVNLCLLAFTSFTLFGGHKADELARIDHEERVHRLEIAIRSELEPARKFVATQLAVEAVNEVLKNPIPEPTKAALIYLVKTVHGPAYREVRVDLLSDMSPAEQLSWRVQNPDSLDYEYQREPIKGSSLSKAFIDDLSQEIRSKLPQNTGSSTDNIESIAQQVLGGVAESQEEWHRQEELIDDQMSRSERSEQFYGEASKGVTEAITTMFSQALGMLSPNVGELAKEWIKEAIGEGVLPSVEHNLEGDTESLLKWSRNNLASGHVHDIPDQIKQEIRSSEAVVSGFLFPAFLTKRGGKTSSSYESKGVPSEILIEIDRRRDSAEKELGGGRHEIDEGGYRPRPGFDPGRPGPLASDDINELERRRRYEERMRERPRGPEIP